MPNSNEIFIIHLAITNCYQTYNSIVQIVRLLPMKDIKDETDTFVFLIKVMQFNSPQFISS